MFHPRHHAAAHPDKPAIVMASTGETVSYAALADGAARCAQLFRWLGLKRGDGVAMLIENHPRFFEVAWGAQSAGLYFTPISTLLTAEEAAYVIGDSGASALMTTARQAEKAAALLAMTPGIRHRLMLDGTAPGYASYETEVAQCPADPVETTQGAPMLYSSGTTGRPKGVRPRLPEGPVDSETPLAAALTRLYGFSSQTVYLSTAPLYHAAPLKFNMAVQALGGTSVILEKFDAEAALAAIERYRVTHAQWVPTMFIRLLKLPDETRAKYDVSSMQKAIHAAAPCPVDIKRRMIDWWGPVIHEYYSGTESNGLCAIGPEEWLAHPGSVGRPARGELHIMDETGEVELPPGEAGLIFFGGGSTFEYHNDPDKTARSRNSRGWTTIGDIGFVDGDGYLYLSDRRDNVIVSGGVNIYPQEAENLLVTHPKVADAAVFGVPNAEFGEEVKAVVQPLPDVAPDAALAQELLAFCRVSLAHYKCPRSIDFDAELPRHPTGKLYKRLIRDRYWPKTDGPVSLAERLSGVSG
ncbi:AMP-binding protein [Emcibacter sp. SYSU 3D8]|uniref:AMP-binding protein n=1 Tax=Emcibacter sp. SYSU 3D8 TaxID=3133969 RepID=UPI0031FF3EB5